MASLAAASDFTGEGTITATGIVLKQGAAILVGSATVASNGNFQVYADLEGSSLTESAAVVAWGPTVDLTGEGSIQSVAAITFSPAADITGEATLSNGATVQYSAASNLMGEGSVIAGEPLDVDQGAADLVGSGVLTADATVWYGGAEAGLVGSGSVVGVFTLRSLLYSSIFRSRVRYLRAILSRERAQEEERLAKKARPSPALAVNPNPVKVVKDESVDPRRASKRL